RILLAAGATVIDLEVGARYLLHRIQNKMNDMVLGHPLAQIARQKHRRLAVQVDKTCSHAHPSPAAPIRSNYFKISSLPKSDRLLGRSSPLKGKSKIRVAPTSRQPTWARPIISSPGPKLNSRARGIR